MSILESPKIEEAMLGTLLTNFELRPILMPKLSVDTFTKPDRKAIFEGIEAIYHSDREVDYLTVEQWLIENKGWKDNETAVLLELDSIYNDPEEKADELNDKKTKRSLFEHIRDVQMDLKSEPSPAADFITRIENILRKQVLDIKIPGMTYSEVLAMEEEKEKRQKLWIDDKFMQNTFFAETGFHKGEILVPFADTGAGKTYWLVWLATKLLESGHKGCLIIRESRARKVFERFEKGISDLSLLDNLIIADIEQGIRNLGDAEQTIKYHNAVSDIDFFGIDHLKILPVEGLNEWQEKQKIQTCINRMISLSQEVNALGIAISQVNRDTLKNAHGWQKDPGLSNLYGSSAIEQAAHMAVSIFRPANYEELCIYNSRGDLEYVKGPNFDDDPTDRNEPNSVFIRQKKVREGEMYRKYVKYLHTDEGLIRDTENDKPKKAPF